MGEQPLVDTSCRYEDYQYEPPKVLLGSELKEQEKKRVVNTYLAIESQAYFEKHHTLLTGKQKRQIRRKFERMYDQGKLKLANLN